MITVMVYDSCTFSSEVSLAAVMGVGLSATVMFAWTVGTEFVLPPTLSVTPLPPPASALVKRNWNVMSSTASPLFSTWIS